MSLNRRSAFGYHYKVYFILTPDGFIKIGLTFDLPQRLRQHAKTPLIGDDLIGWIRGMRHTETTWHRRFKEIRVFNEVYLNTAQLDFAINRAIEWDGQYVRGSPHEAPC